MAQRHPIQHAGLDEPQKEGPPHLPRGLFQVVSGLQRQIADLGPMTADLEAQPLRQGADELRVGVRFRAPQPVVDVQNAELEIPPRRQLQQHVEQAHRVRAARDGHADPLAAHEHAEPLDGLGHARQHLPIVESRGPGHFGFASPPPAARSPPRATLGSFGLGRRQNLFRFGTEPARNSTGGPRRNQAGFLR